LYIVVVGGGKVGDHLAKSLIADGEEVLVIEKDAEKVARITRELGATAIQGDGAEVATLENAGVERADVVAAVTGHDEDNLIISQVAKGRFDVPRTVARINNPRNEYVFHHLGIDATVSATQVILAVVQQAIPGELFVHLRALRGGGVELVELELTETSSAGGKALRELQLPPDSAVPLLVRRGRPVVVQADTTLESGDHIIAVTTTEQEQALRGQLLG